MKNLLSLRVLGFSGFALSVLTVSPLLIGAAPQVEIPGACTADSPNFVTDEGGCKDIQTGLVYSANTVLNVGTCGWDFTNKYCGSLVEGGFDDWRLPTLNELRASQPHGTNGVISLNYMSDGTPTRVWTSTQSKSNMIQFNHLDGSYVAAGKKSWTYSNCVRSGSPSP